jgi:uncharacterized protein DUF559
MHEAIHDVLTAHDGVAARRALLEATGHRVLERAIAHGDVIRPFPRTYLSAVHQGDLDAMVRAAISYSRRTAVLSHTSALKIWGLPAPAGGPIHLSTGPAVHLRGAPGLVVHRRKYLVLEPPEVVVRKGLPVTRLETTIMDCWPLLDGDAKRAPAIVAVNDQLTTPDRLLSMLPSYPRIAGRRHLLHLVELLRAGCRSALELWGYQYIFTGRPFANLVWQFPVRVDGRVFYLDALDRATGTNFELDGTKYHSSAVQRERDMRRDAALQSIGIAVVRLSHRRLTREPGQVRAEAVRIMAARPSGWTLPDHAIVRREAEHGS